MLNSQDHCGTSLLLSLGFLTGGWLLATSAPGWAQSSAKLNHQRVNSQQAGQQQAGQQQAGQTRGEQQLAGQLNASESSLLVAPEDLDLNADQRILDTRSVEAYQLGHIPGAFQVDVAIWKTQARQPGGMRDQGKWSALAGKIGLTTKTPVVVYGGSLTSAARIWWTLKYLGVEKVRLLDGGWEEWKRLKRPVSREVPQIERTAFRPDFQPHRLAVLADLKQSVQNRSVGLVDSRTPQEYSGEIVQGSRAGCIPLAAHLEWKETLQANGRFKKPAELRRQYLQAGIDLNQPAVTYCYTGGRASVNAFALELAGFAEVRNYYGGWKEWSGDQTAPIETPSKSPKQP